MTITPLPVPPALGVDAPSIDAIAGSPPAASAGSSFAGALERAFASAGDALEKADRSERAFARGNGGLQEMVLDRAQADIALTIATSAASKTSQALTTILGMQV